jgi:uncharacterized protein (DUF1800 family)
MGLGLAGAAALAPWTPLSQSAWAKPTDKSERDPRLSALNRMAFGPSAEDLADPATFRLASHVEEQLHPETVADAVCDKKLEAAGLSSLGKPLKQLWLDYHVEADRIRDMDKAGPQASPSPGGSPSPGSANSAADLAQKRSMDENHLRQQPARETEAATWLRAVYSKRQLQEVLAEFWHDHFNVFAWDNNIGAVFTHYDRDVIRKNALGNFREMLEAVAKSPAMLFYLDGFVNQSGNPNENFARELFELHTLGAEHYLGTRDRRSVSGFASGSPVGYVDGDVYEAARCFTGWRLDGTQKDATDTGEFSYYDPWHDRFQKIVLGRALPEYQPAMKDGNDVLDLLAAHRGTAVYVSRKLCRKLVGDEPRAELVEATAKVFHDERKSSDQLRQVVRAILKSPDFRESERKKLKRPFEFTAGLLRATGADFYPSDQFLNNYQRAGQKLFGWRTPDGYPDSHLRWSGTTPMLERWRMANQLLTGKIDRVKVELGAELRDAAQAARAWARRYLGEELAPRRQRALEEFLSKDPSQNDRMRGSVALLFMSPEFLWK